jgi:hypothetical protein
MWGKILKREREVVEWKLRKWWSREKFNNGKFSSYYDNCVNDVLWYHLEREILYNSGYMGNLKRWRKAREVCLGIIGGIRNDLEIIVRKIFLGKKREMILQF